MRGQYSDAADTTASPGEANLHPHIVAWPACHLLIR